MKAAASQPSLKWEETTPEVHTLEVVRVSINIIRVTVINTVINNIINNITVTVIATITK